MIKRILKVLKDWLLRLISIPVYLTLGLNLIVIFLIEIGMTNGSLIKEIIVEYKKNLNEKRKSISN